MAWLMERRGAQAQPVRFPAQSKAPSGAEAVRLALADGRPPRPRRPTSRCRRRTRAACSRPTRRCRSPAGCGRTATPTRRSRCCGASCATSPQGRGLAEVYAALGLILLEDLREPTAAYQYLLSALELGPRPEVEATVRDALKRIETLQKRRVGELRRPSW